MVEVLHPEDWLTSLLGILRRAKAALRHCAADYLTKPTRYCQRLMCLEPFTAQSAGTFSAGNPQGPEEIPATQIDEPQKTWEPPVGRYHPREVEHQSPAEPSPNKIPEQTTALPATGLTTEVTPPADELGGNEGLDEVVDKVAPEDSVSEAGHPQTGGNPYWKLLG